MTTQPPNAQFDTAEEALKWAVEVLRRRRLPRMTSLWREIEAEQEWVAQAWEGAKNTTLPSAPDERMDLALKVMDALERAGDAKLKRLLLLWSMGDWADEGRLAAAMAVQERCRREGMRVRLSYRYSYAQVATIIGGDRKTAWRHVQDALTSLGQELAQKGLMGGIEGADMVSDNFKKIVYYHEFKIDNE